MQVPAGLPTFSLDHTLLTRLCMLPHHLCDPPSFPFFLPPCSLRAALNSTHGGPGSDPFFQLGLTPASVDPTRAGSLPGGRRGTKRASGQLLRRDSESGMASEK